MADLVDKIGTYLENNLDEAERFGNVGWDRRPAKPRQTAEGMTEEFAGKTYKKGPTLRFDQLRVGDIVFYTYKNGGQLRSDIFKFTGFSDAKQKYGESGPRFHSWKEVAAEHGCTTLASIDAKFEEMEHGHGIYMCGEFGNGDKGCYFYIYENAWARGSGADKMSMSRAVEVSE